MRTLLLLLVVVLSLGAYFSGGKPGPEPDQPGCRSEDCRKLRFSNPGYHPHCVRD